MSQAGTLKGTSRDSTRSPRPKASTTVISGGRMTRLAFTLKLQSLSSPIRRDDAHAMT